MSFAIVYRQIGNNFHFLNCTTGQIMSFDLEAGLYLLGYFNNSEIANDINAEVRHFFSKSECQINSRKSRGTLIDLGMEFLFPTTVNIELNRRCSLRCQHCYIPLKQISSGRNSFFDTCTLSDIRNLLHFLHKLGVFLIVLTGGEPFLNKNIEPTLLEAVEKDFIVEIFSNLQFVPKWFKAIEPSQVRVGRIQTSVYSALPTIHDTVTGLAGSFDRTIKNLLSLREKGYYVEVSTPLLSINFDTRHQTEDYFARLGISQSFAWPIVNEYYNGSKGKRLLNISKGQFLDFCREKPEFLIKSDFSRKDGPICAAARALFAISADGDIFPCSQFPQKVGSFLTSNLEEVWKSEAMCKIRGYRLGDLPDNSYPYAFCMGNNYSETGHPLLQPKFMREVFEHYEINENKEVKFMKKKAVKKIKPLWKAGKAKDKDACTKCATRSSSH